MYDARLVTFRLLMSNAATMMIKIRPPPRPTTSPTMSGVWFTASELGQLVPQTYDTWMESLVAPVTPNACECAKKKGQMKQQAWSQSYVMYDVEQSLAYSCARICIGERWP